MKNEPLKAFFEQKSQILVILARFAAMKKIENIILNSAGYPKISKWIGLFPANFQTPN